MTRIRTISCLSVREPGAALSPLSIHFERVQILVFCSIFVDVHWVFANHYIFSWDQKLTSNTHTTLRKWAKSSEAETASSKRRPVQPPLPFYKKDAQPAKKWQVNNVLPPRRLIATSLLSTETVARSKHSSSKKLLLHEKLPKPPKGASKLTSFCAILAVRMHAAVQAEGLLAPSSARFSVDKRCRLCKGLGSLLSYPLLVATLCFNPAEGPQTASRSAECRVRATMYTGPGSTHTWRATERRLHFDSPTRTRVNSDSCVNDGYCLHLFSVDTSPTTSKVSWHLIVVQSVRIDLQRPVFGRSTANGWSGWRRDFLSNRKYQYRPCTQPDVWNCLPCAQRNHHPTTNNHMHNTVNFRYNVWTLEKLYQFYVISQQCTKLGIRLLQFNTVLVKTPKTRNISFIVHFFAETYWIWGWMGNHHRCKALSTSGLICQPRTVS